MTTETTETTKRPVVVTTEHRGIFFGYVEDDSKAPLQITLSCVRNVLVFPQATRGFLGLASSGPPSGSRVGPAAGRATFYQITSVSDCTPEAAAAWEKAPWQ